MAKRETIFAVAEWLKEKRCKAMPYGNKSVHLVFEDGEFRFHAFVHDYQDKLTGDLLIDSRYLSPMGYPTTRGHRVTSVVQLVVSNQQCAVATPASLLESSVVEKDGAVYYSVPEELYETHSLDTKAGQLFRMEEFDEK